MDMQSRDTMVARLKCLWLGEEVCCPQCGAASLTRLHKKAKKSNNDWVCPACGKIYRTINMLYHLPEK